MRENVSLFRQTCSFKQYKKRSATNYDRLKKCMEFIRYCNVKHEEKSKILLEKGAKSRKKTKLIYWK